MGDEFFTKTYDQIYKQLQKYGHELAKFGLWAIELSWFHDRHN